MKKIISLFLFIYVSYINAQSFKDTTTIRLMIDSVLSIKSNAIKERIKKENTVISNISFLKKFPIFFTGPIWQNIWRNRNTAVNTRCDIGNVFRQHSAREKTRTSIPFRVLPPQGSASTNFATRAYFKTCVLYPQSSQAGF